MEILRLRSVAVVLGALTGVAVGAQGKEPSAKEMYEAYAGYWHGVSRNLESTAERCRSGELKGLACIGPATSGIKEVKVLALDKYKCVVAPDRNGHNCTFKPEVEVRGSNETMAKSLETSLNTQKTNLFRRASGTMTIEARSDQ